MIKATTEKPGSATVSCKDTCSSAIPYIRAEISRHRIWYTLSLKVEILFRTLNIPGVTLGYDILA